MDSVVFADDDNRQLTGTVTAIEELSGAETDAIGKSSKPTSLLIVVLQDDEIGLQGGERVKVSIRKTDSGNLLLVSNESVHHDSQGAFLYTISAKQGPLGNAYCANETRIETVGSNDYATAVSVGLFEQSEIITGSSGLIKDGTRVRY